MKKILSLLFVAVFVIEGIAQNSNLTIFSEDGLPFYLILNGIRQNENPETNVRVDNLLNPYYTTKIIFADQNLPAIEKKMTMVIDADEKRGEATYKIKANKKGQQVMKFFSFTPAAQVLPPPPSVRVVSYNTAPMAAINFNTQFSETTTTTTSSSSTSLGSSMGTSENVNVGISVGGMNIGANVNVNDHSGHNHSGHNHSGHNHAGHNHSEHSHVSHTTTTTVINNAPVAPVIVEEVGCQPMDRNSFQGALASIENQNFSDSRLSQAKQITSSNCLTASQIKEVVKVFSFEDARLEFAKFAYKYCFDQNNYWQVNDAFNFSSSSEELNEYIRR